MTAKLYRLSGSYGTQLLHCPRQAELLQLGRCSEHELSEWEDQEVVLHRGSAGTVRSRSFARNVFAKGYPIMYKNLSRSIQFQHSNAPVPFPLSRDFAISVLALVKSSLSTTLSALGLGHDFSRGSRPSAMVLMQRGSLDTTRALCVATC